MSSNLSYMQFSKDTKEKLDNLAKDAIKEIYSNMTQKNEQDETK